MIVLYTGSQERALLLELIDSLIDYKCITNEAIASPAATIMIKKNLSIA